ncbi:aminotransferase [Roseomonas hellenica]|uniref:aspartate transaminase n=1 Tax=Plastoroseomonas hellenica TaxID=2687306 RepID=A0ABS5F6Z3_9PROT|nr:aminotransferase [Plastoroseomonas hellenica]
MSAPRFAARIERTAAPPIPAVRAWAARYAGAAGPLLDMTQAVPGYPAHPELLARLGAAAADPAQAGYGPIEGDMPLRAALAADIAGTYGADIAAEEVVITAGCNLAFAMAMETIAGAGDAVLLPTPWYFNHRMALEMLGIEAVPLPARAEDGFVPDPATAAALIGPATRAIVLVTPNNPTGAIYPAATIAGFAALCRARGLWLVLDETYRDFLPEDAIAHDLFRDGAWRDGVVQLYSFSKSYCVPGHRVGAILAGPAFRAQLAKAVDTFQICPPRAAQAALAWGVPALADWRAGNRAIMAGRADAFRRALAPLQDWRIESMGTYFAYLRLPEAAPDAEAAAERLAVERGLLCLPGSFFGPGQARHIRLAFANAEVSTIAGVTARLAGFA